MAQVNYYLHAARDAILAGDHITAERLMFVACSVAAKTRSPQFGKCIIALNAVRALVQS